MKILEKIDKLEEQGWPKGWSKDKAGKMSNLFKSHDKIKRKVWKIIEAEAKKLGFKSTPKTHDLFALYLYKILESMKTEEK